MPSLLKWLRVSSPLLHYITIHVFHQWHYLTLEYLVKSAPDFCKVRTKLSSTLSKASRSCFLITSHCHHQPLHCLILTFRSNYDACYHSFSIRTSDLHIVSTRIFGYCLTCLVILVVPVDLCILSVRSSECKNVISCIGDG